MGLAQYPAAASDPEYYTSPRTVPNIYIRIYRLFLYPIRRYMASKLIKLSIRLLGENGLAHHISMLFVSEFLFGLFYILLYKVKFHIMPNENIFSLELYNNTSATFFCFRSSGLDRRLRCSYPTTDAETNAPPEKKRGNFILSRHCWPALVSKNIV